MATEARTFETSGHVARATLNRPDALNALDAGLLGELANVCEQVNADPTIRVVGFTGAGRAFCAGGDVKTANFANSKGTPTAQKPEDHWAARLLAIQKPTIAAVNGVAAGGGLSLALACDLRVASDRARFSAIFARIGMSVLDGAGWLLSRAVGHAKALEMLFTADMIDAAEAERIGLVNHVVEHDALLDEAHSLADRIAAKPPVALALSKRVVYGAIGKTYLEHLPDQWAAQAENLRLARHDILEGGRAFREKREPIFRGLEVDLPEDPER